MSRLPSVLLHSLRSPSARATALPAILLAALGSAASLSAQITVTATVTTPWTTSVALGPQTDQDSTPIAAAVDSSLTTGPASAYAGIDFVRETHTWGCRCGIRQQLYLDDTGAVSPASAAASSDVLLMLHSPQPLAVDLYLASWPYGSGGATAPVVEFDVDDDGTIESSTWGTSIGFSIVLGPGAKVVRIRLQSSVQGLGFAGADALVLVSPTPHLATSLAGVGCSTRHGLAPVGTLDGNAELYMFGLDAEHYFAVLGLGQQPFFLPAAGASPCLWLPTPDILLGYWPASGVFVDELPLALPASLRPVTFWVQSLAIGPLGITTGDAWRVDAF